MLTGASGVVTPLQRGLTSINPGYGPIANGFCFNRMRVDTWSQGVDSNEKRGKLHQHGLFLE